MDPPNLVHGYRDLSILHRSIAAVTYRALHQESDTAVVLRVRRDGAQTPPDELAALKRASRDDHIVTVLETGWTATGRPYTASSHCARGDLASSAPVPVRAAVQAAVSAGKGLRALHDEGLIHGAVTPGRFLHGGKGALLTGMATLRGLAAHSAPCVLEPVDLERVDPGFAAPEVLRRRPQTTAADVYGLGAALWGLLAGRAPFTADDRWAVREQALTQATPQVPLDDVPEWLANLIAKAMAGDAADRYPTVTAFIDALRQGLPDAPTLPAGRPHLLGRPPEASVPPLRQDIRQAPDAPPPAFPPPPPWLPPPPPPPFLPLPALPPPPPPPAPVTSPRRFMPVAVVALAVFAAAAAGLGAAGLKYGMDAVGGRPQKKPARSSAPTSTPTTVRPAEEYAPGQVRIVDHGTSIEVTWEDRSGGQVAHYVVGGPRGRTVSTLATAAPGAEKAVVAALNPSVDYCLTVVAVADVDRVARAEPVCTRRVKRKD